MRRAVYAGVIYWLCFFALIIWAISRDLAQPSQQLGAPQHKSGTEKEITADNPLHRFWEWSTHDPVAFYTMVLAIFTGSLVVISSVQIRFLIRADETARITAEAARNSARTMENTAERQLRAYVLLGPDIHPDVSQDGEIRINFGIRNFGQTPAYDVIQWTALGIFDPSELQQLESPHEVSADAARLIIAPQSFAGGMAILADKQSAETLAEITDGAKELYFWGQIFYNDAFGIPRISKYRLRSSGLAFAARRLIYCNDGNDAT